MKKSAPPPPPTHTHTDAGRSRDRRTAWSSSSSDGSACLDARRGADLRAFFKAGGCDPRGAADAPAPPAPKNDGLNEIQDDGPASTRGDGGAAVAGPEPEADPERNAEAELERNAEAEGVPTPKAARVPFVSDPRRADDGGLCLDNVASRRLCSSAPDVGAGCDGARRPEPGGAVWAHRDGRSNLAFGASTFTAVAPPAEKGLRARSGNLAFAAPGVRPPGRGVATTAARGDGDGAALLARARSSAHPGAAGIGSCWSATARAPRRRGATFAAGSASAASGPASSGPSMSSGRSTTN